MKALFASIICRTSSRACGWYYTFAATVPAEAFQPAPVIVYKLQLSSFVFYERFHWLFLLQMAQIADNLTSEYLLRSVYVIPGKCPQA